MIKKRLSQVEKKIDKLGLEKSRVWLEKQIYLNQDDFVLRYFNTEVLWGLNKDDESIKAEIYFFKKSSELIADKKCKGVELALLYYLRGQLKFYAVDREKEAEKAKLLLKRISNINPDKIYLIKCLNDLIKSGNRQVLYFYDEDGRFEIA